MTRKPSCDDFAGVASLFAEELNESDRAAYEAHLDECAACRDLARQSTQALAELFLSVPPVKPAARVRDELMRRVAESSSSASPLQAQFSTGFGLAGMATLQTVRAGDTRAWEQTAVPGVSIRTLSVDRERDQFSALVRMEPGATYPRHVHGGAEHCVVLEGTLRVGGDVLSAGDYQLAPAGSGHGVQSTDDGCLLFIVSSLHDQFD